jgi:hypothetical protein
MKGTGVIELIYASAFHLFRGSKYLHRHSLLLLIPRHAPRLRDARPNGFIRAGCRAGLPDSKEARE